MHIQSFFDPGTSTITHVISDPSTHYCAVVDPVHDFDLPSGRLESKSADRVIDYIRKNNLKLEWILETHVHADHLTAASYIKGKLGGKIGIGEHIKTVLSYWVPLFNTRKDTPLDGSQFDVLFEDKAEFKIGSLNVQVMHTPGHTPDCVSYHVNDALFAGDTIFMPYVGTARTDFPGGGAAMLYQSIQKILALPDETRIHMCHDYPPPGQDPAWVSTVLEEKKKNILINESVTEADFVEARNKRDFDKAVPRLLYPSIQVNIRAGRLGSPESNQSHYIKVPVTEGS